MPDGTSAANFEVEVDGVSVFKATSAEGFGKTHEPYKIPVGNKEMPVLGRGRSECKEVTMVGAFALNGAAAEFHRIFKEYSNGDNVTKPNVRVLQYDERGKSVIHVHECTECAPTGYLPKENKGDSKDAAMFEIKFLPSDYNQG
ncbi:MAG: hypothetical protein M3209_00185 [Acidobacteriota bacterium]|nr:hypothetical protein [Acidobacteriota bacterium]